MTIQFSNGGNGLSSCGGSMDPYMLTKVNHIASYRPTLTTVIYPGNCLSATRFKSVMLPIMDISLIHWKVKTSFNKLS